MQLSNRMIKPDFWHDSEISKNLPPTGRMFYQGLWQLSEDSGVIEADPTAFKMILFPLDDVAVKKIESWTETLVELKKLIPFKKDNKKYYFLKNFHKHQSLRSPGKPELPLPDFVEYVESDKKYTSGGYIINYDAIDNGQCSGKVYVGNIKVDESKANTNKKQSEEKANDNPKESLKKDKERDKEGVEKAKGNRTVSVEKPQGKHKETNKNKKLEVEVEKEVRSNKNTTNMPDSSGGENDSNSNSQASWPSQLEKEGSRYDYPEKFEKIWAVYPDRKPNDEKYPAYKKVRSLIVNHGEEYDDLLRAAKIYKEEQIQENNVGTKHVKMCKTFFSVANRPYLSYIEGDVDNDGGSSLPESTIDYEEVDEFVQRIGGS